MPAGGGAEQSVLWAIEGHGDGGPAFPIAENWTVLGEATTVSPWGIAAKWLWYFNGPSMKG